MTHPVYTVESPKIKSTPLSFCGSHLQHIYALPCWTKHFLDIYSDMRLPFYKILDMVLTICMLRLRRFRHSVNFHLQWFPHTQPHSQGLSLLPLPWKRPWERGSLLPWLSASRSPNKRFSRWCHFITNTGIHYVFSFFFKFCIRVIIIITTTIIIVVIIIV